MPRGIAPINRPQRIAAEDPRVGSRQVKQRGSSSLGWPNARGLKAADLYVCRRVSVYAYKGTTRSSINYTRLFQRNDRGRETLFISRGALTTKREIPPLRPSARWMALFLTETPATRLPSIPVEGKMDRKVEGDVYTGAGVKLVHE